MKKLLVILMFTTSILFACSDTGKQDASPVSAMSESEESSVKEIDFMGENRFEIIGDYGIHPVIMGKWIDEGYDLFTLEDGEELEEIILNTIVEHEKKVEEDIKEYGENISDRPIIPHDDKLKIFEKNILKNHPDKKDYIEKLSEANGLIESKDEEAVKEKIEEARKLRESK